MSDLQSYKDYYNKVYSSGDNATKILLKAWLYQMHYIGVGMDFTTYTAFYNITDVVIMLKGYCIDVSDIGTPEYCIDVLVRYGKRGKQL